MSTLAIRCRLDRGSFCLDVDLALPAHGVTVLFGPSGSGKTTLLRLIAGLERAPGARITLNNEVWDDGRHLTPTHRRPIGYVFQEASLFPHLTARANIDYGRRRSAQQLGDTAFTDLIARLGISSMLDRKPDQLSGGERQRVAIARALATRPKLLLMDEPLAALDQARKQDFLPYLERLHDELDIPMLYVTHSPDEAARLADYMVVLDAGSVRAAGSLSEVFARTDLPLAQDDEAGVVWEGQIEQHDAAYHLSRLNCGGGALWVRATDKPLGTSLRVRILARDVSLTLTPQTDTSILNILPATVRSISADAQSAQALVWLNAGGLDAGVALCARITRRSVDRLGLRPGMPVWAQIKSVALLR
ncbi:MAG: molybdenum ABC transporter ATP-binding protein [Thiobacillaceae bacterium]